MLRTVQIEECSDPENRTDPIVVPTNEFMLMVDKKRYRFSINQFDGCLEIALINGIDAHVKTVSGYPGIKLVSK